MGTTWDMKWNWADRGQGFPEMGGPILGSPMGTLSNRFGCIYCTADWSWCLGCHIPRLLQPWPFSDSPPKAAKLLSNLAWETYECQTPFRDVLPAGDYVAAGSDHTDAMASGKVFLFIGLKGCVPECVSHAD